MDRVKAKSIIINEVRDLPTLPDVIHKVLALVGDENSSAKQLGNMISYDQAISSRLLKVANSAYYGFMKKIATVHHAIVILGFKEVKSLVLGITVLDTMKGASSEASFMQDEFWIHSMGSALAGQIICKEVEGADPETIFTASLLHDIGKLVLDVSLPQEYIKVLEKVRISEVSIVDAEEEVLGFNHADVGGWLCERWKFPPVLTFPISFHHRIENVDKNYLRVASIVHLADNLCKRAQIGNSGDNTIPMIYSSAQKHLGLRDDDLEIMVEQLTQKEDKVKSFLSSI